MTALRASEQRREYAGGEKKALFETGWVINDRLKYRAGFEEEDICEVRNTECKRKLKWNFSIRVRCKSEAVDKKEGGSQKITSVPPLPPLAWAVGCSGSKRNSYLPVQ